MVCSKDQSEITVFCMYKYRKKSAQGKLTVLHATIESSEKVI